MNDSTGDGIRNGMGDGMGDGISDGICGDSTMNIGEAAQRSGVSAKMVRHYEALGLLPQVPRTDSGYRRYGARELHTLRFIRQGRALGFSMAEIADLLKLWQNRRRASADVKRIALAHIADLERKMTELAAMQATLQQLASCCHGDSRPDCPILEGLAQPLRCARTHVKNAR